MAGGRFDARVTVQREASTGELNAYGNPTGDAWETVGELWGEFRETPAKERLLADRKKAERIAVLRLRASTVAGAISAQDRVIIRGEVWGVIAPPTSPDSRRLVEVALKFEGAAQ